MMSKDGFLTNAVDDRAVRGDESWWRKRRFTHQMHRVKVDTRPGRPRSHRVSGSI